MSTDADVEKKRDKRNRTTARCKFKRSYNAISEHIDDTEVSMETLNELFKKLDLAYTELEAATSQYLTHFDEEDDEIKNSTGHLEDSYIMHTNIFIKLTKRKQTTKESKFTRDTKLLTTHELQSKMHVKKLDTPKFSGNLRDFPIFIKDYIRYMEPTFGDDPYALRSCLSGKALEAVIGVDDDYSEMWKRLKITFGDSEKLVDSVLSEIRGLKPIKENDGNALISLVKLLEKCWLDLKRMKLECEMDTATMTSYVERLLPPLQKREWTKLKQQRRSTDEYYGKKFEPLLEFLILEKDAVEYMKQEIRDCTTVTDKVGTIHMSERRETNAEPTLSTLQRAVEDLTKTISSWKPRNGRNVMEDGGNSSGVNKSCWLHNSDTHIIADCHSFMSMTNEQKINMIKQKGACYRCLQRGHLSRDCPTRAKCTIMIVSDESSKPCDKAHHPVLHEAHVAGISFHHARNRSKGDLSTTLLMVSRIDCISCSYNAVLDPCSNLSLITHRAARKLNLKGRDITMSITKVGNVTDVITTKEYTVSVRDKDNKIWTIQVYGIDEVTSNLGKVDVSRVVELFRDIQINDIERPTGEVDLLLGLDCCTLLPNKIAQVDNLQLLNGPLGYCLRGSHRLLQFENSIGTHHLNVSIHKTYINPSNTQIDLISHEVRDFFNIEAVGTSLLPTNCVNCKNGNENIVDNTNISIKEKKELDLIKEGLKYNKENRCWTTSYPWIRNADELPNNYVAAFGQLKSLERRLIKNGNEQLYCEQVQDMLNRNVVRKLTADEIKNYNGPVHYIPHHGVIKESSTSTPLRIVFNSSSSFMGHKINDYWAKGPDMLNSLVGILIKFREDRVGIHGDISKMFNSVRLDEVEMHTHRFLWRNLDTSRSPDHYIILAVPFGDRPSGAIVIIAMYETAIMNIEVFPLAAEVIMKNSFVDDILKSVANTEDARKLCQEVEQVLSTGGFRIKKWIISGVGDYHGKEEGDENTSWVCDDEDVDMVEMNEEKVLGMVWNANRDILKYKINLPVNLSVVTRRSALSHTSKLYDPLGLLSPFTLKAKLLMRELCMVKKDVGNNCPDWDMPLSGEMKGKFTQFFTEMSLLKDVQFNRSIKPENAVGSPMLIIFSDGSQHAYGACVYIRWKLADGSYVANLIIAKNRLAPFKTMTIPRIELMGAVIACRLRAVVLKELTVPVESVYHIIDSQIVLEQLRKDSYKFGVFVGNRVAEVQNSTKVSDWWWTESQNNGADRVTRPSGVCKLGDDWKHGPSYLVEDISKWPISQERKYEEEDLPDVVKKCHSVSGQKLDLKVNLGFIEMDRFGTLDKLIMVTAIIMKIISQKSFKCNPKGLDWSDAYQNWIMYVQKDIMDGWKTRFKRLGVKMINEILVVGDRMSSWLKDNYDVDHLILLPGKSKFSKLVVSHYHNINHDGVDATVARVRSKYWIPNMRRISKEIRRSCYTCRIQDKELCVQKMGRIPDERLKPSPPFYHTGVDLFGPIWVKDVVKKRTKLKCYGVIFNCFTTRAIFLDIACGYDTDNFLMVLRRFMAIRGCPSEVRSDPGSQLIKASKELKEYFNHIDSDLLDEFSSKHGIKWIVNKSADAPWQNGCTERLIRSVKRCLMLTIGTNILNFQELQTVFYECANIMNERPIGIKTTDHTYFCPNQLLLGRSSVKMPNIKYDHELNPRKRFQFIENLTQSYWRRWQVHYFPSLILQQKWHVESRNLRVDDVVLVQDTKSLRGMWKLAEVTLAIPSKDGKVRDVELRYKNLTDDLKYNGAKDVIIKRSVHRLVLIIPAEERADHSC